ncbi:hypothetical protein CHS0354_017638 [Potamilus streckersoni]|uniref:G-protein coupled receptors family 1 profile domain-containing protein n=1 Tax=Potamilus streckersoni TaxID=2493646 RepID=A0AAE0T1Z5_9BIVA|nr:hypothetical protein CHS0354_017638 [Potamilus streckersoni]
MDILNLTLELTTSKMATVTTNQSVVNVTQQDSSIMRNRQDVDKYITPFIYAVGFPGNLMSFIIWLQKRMRHSSGCYLASLAMTDFIFLMLHVMYELHEVWKVDTVDYPGICESFTIVFLAAQYLSPLLVLAFTVERYISICHPFTRERYCTPRLAVIIVVSLAVFSLAICGIQGYFYRVDPATNLCNVRKEIIEGGTNSFWTIWTWITEMLIFLVVPLSVLIFNVMVILEARRLSKFEQHQLKSRSQKTSATTFMLLAVSFYLIFTTLPVTIVYVSYFSFPEGKDNIIQATDHMWQRHFKYLLARKIIEEFGMTHYALNFYIYMITGKVFRQEFKRLFFRFCVKEIPERVRTEYSTLRSSFRGSMKNMTVRLTNGHSHKEGNETHV